MDALTKLEEEIMLIIWDLKQAFVKDIIEKMPEPKPHYNTISTIVRILVDKKMLHFEVFGKTHRYYPLVDRERYKKSQLKPLVKKYFNNSAKQMVSFFINENNLSITELEELIKQYKKTIS